MRASAVPYTRSALAERDLPEAPKPDPGERVIDSADVVVIGSGAFGASAAAS